MTKMWRHLAWHYIWNKGEDDELFIHEFRYVLTRYATSWAKELKQE